MAASKTDAPFAALHGGSLTMNTSSNYFYTRTLSGSHELPFGMTRIPLSDLKVNDIICEEKAWDGCDDVVVLYKVKRINKKTVTVMDCDQYGLRWREGDCRKLKIYTGCQFNVLGPK